MAETENIQITQSEARRHSEGKSSHPFSSRDLGRWVADGGLTKTSGYMEWTEEGDDKK